MIHVGTDCSGIEAPIQALKLLDVKFKHCFSSDIDENARKSILANYSPDILFNDMTAQRDLPLLDIYICGFPCQPFSTIGRRGGSDDPRANVFDHCIKTILQTKTNVFILENVSGIVTVDGGQYFKQILNKLNELTDYYVTHTFLNTNNYGIPQNRNRIFFIGIKNSIMIKKFEVPKTIECKDIMSFVDFSCTKKDVYSNSYLKTYDQFKDSIFANLGVLWPQNKNYKVNSLYCPTITTTGEIWCVHLQRRATVKEYLSLQGFPENFKQVVSNRQLKKQVGNSMSVNVLVCLFEELFKCVKL